MQDNPAPTLVVILPVPDIRVFLFGYSATLDVTPSVLLRLVAELWLCNKTNIKIDPAVIIDRIAPELTVDHDDVILDIIEAMELMKAAIDKHLDRMVDLTKYCRVWLDVATLDGDSIVMVVRVRGAVDD